MINGLMTMLLVRTVYGLIRIGCLAIRLKRITHVIGYRTVLYMDVSASVGGDDTVFY